MCSSAGLRILRPSKPYLPARIAPSSPSCVCRLQAVSTMVVYVHGLWLTGIEGGILRRRLAKTLSVETRVFSYASVRLGLAANAQALAKFLGDLRTDTLHLVGHSLGG